MLALPIFPGSRPPSIVGVHELNFCVRDGNRWTLMTINTNYLSATAFTVTFLGDPYRIRTDVNGVRGRCLNHLTNGPLVHLHGLEPGTHWLRVSCSTNWAKGAGLGVCTLKTEHCILSAITRVWQHWACFRSSFRLISISQLNMLPHLHLWPINDIVYVEPQWRSYLRGSFTLRCLQRLSRPYVATQPCPWQNNWYTRGTSNPVLSY